MAKYLNSQRVWKYPRAAKGKSSKFATAIRAVQDQIVEYVGHYK